MYYVTSRLKRVTHGEVARTFCEGPFAHLAQAQTCARINARKLGIALKIISQQELEIEDNPILDAQIDTQHEADMAEWRAMNGITEE